MNRIKAVKPGDNRVIFVVFQNGIEKEYDVRKLYSVFPQFQILETDETLFRGVKADLGGYGISWSDELDLDAEEIWENGISTGRRFEFDIMDILAESLANAREHAGVTQKQLSERIGIYQADISKIERGLANPSVTTLNRLASGMNMRLKIEFIPNNEPDSFQKMTEEDYRLEYVS